MLAHWDELTAIRRREPSETKSITNEVLSDPPRRCQSLVNFNENRHRRERSAQPSIPEGQIQFF